MRQRAVARRQAAAFVALLGTMAVADARADGPVPIGSTRLAFSSLYGAVAPATPIAVPPLPRSEGRFWDGARQNLPLVVGGAGLLGAMAVLACQPGAAAAQVAPREP